MIAGRVSEVEYICTFNSLTRRATKTVTASLDYYFPLREITKNNIPMSDAKVLFSDAY